jgi:SnoaL-like protein
MNAAERFFAASRAHDADAAIAELAADVVMLNPATDDPIVGKAAVAGALAAVEAACDEFRHTHLLAADSPGQRALYGLVFEARIGTATLRGVDLIELGAGDLITRFEVAARPIGALMALGSRMGSGPTP